MKLNAEAVAEEKATSLEKVLEQITVDGNFNAQCFWKIRKAMGRKDPMCTSVINEDGKEVYGVEGIKKGGIHKGRPADPPGGRVGKTGQNRTLGRGRGGGN